MRIPGQREKETLSPCELAHDFLAQWLCTDSALFSTFITLAFFWRGPLTTKEELREKLAYKGSARMFWGFFFSWFSLNYEESTGSCYTQAKKKL